MVDGKKLLQAINELYEDIQKNHDALMYLDMQHNRIQEEVERVRELIREEGKRCEG